MVFRVISWIVSSAQKRTIHEVTRTDTKQTRTNLYLFRASFRLCHSLSVLQVSLLGLLRYRDNSMASVLLALMDDYAGVYRFAGARDDLEVHLVVIDLEEHE